MKYMHSYPSAVPVLEKWEEYVRIHPEGNLGHFATWLQQREQEAAPVSTEAARMTVYLEREKFTESSDFQYKADQYAGYLIGRLYKFVRFYMKPLLQEAGLNNVEDFGFLASLEELKQANKKELIEANMSEPTTGLDIIKRLVNQGLMEEKVHPQDRRAKLLLMTDKGKEALQRVVLSFRSLPEIMPNMDEKDKEALIQTLEQLDRYHTNSFEKYK